MLTIDGSQAWFNGNIYANNINGLIEGWQIGSLNADVINAGTINAIDIYGCRIMWPGVTMTSPAPGWSTIAADNSFAVTQGDNYIGMNEFGLTLRGVPNIIVGNIFDPSANTIILMGTLKTQDVNGNIGTGISGTFVL